MNSLGDGLSVVIRAEHRLHHDWMAFASWYSFTKNLPDAQISLVCVRNPKIFYEFLIWPKKVGLKVVMYPPGDGEPHLYAAHIAMRSKNAFQPMFVVDAWTMVLREPDKNFLAFLEKSLYVESEDNTVWYFKDIAKEAILGLGDPAVVCGLSTASQDASLSMLSCSNTCGNFNITGWIDRQEYPFPHADKFAKTQMSANEVQILNLWKSMDTVFSTTSRG